MAGRIDQRLAELGITVPTPAAPIANYVPFVVTGNLVVISGQIPLVDGKVAFTGKVSEDITPERAKEAARACFVNLLAQLKAATGDLDRVKRVVKLGVFVNSTDDFTDQPKVANGVSDLMVEVFGEAGKHARFAVGTNVLPLDLAVEVDAVFEIA